MTKDIKFKILKHLSANSDSWSSTVSKVCSETMAGQMFVERAMQDLVESGQVKRKEFSSGPKTQYYALEGMDNPTTSGGVEPDPRKIPLNDKTAT